MNYHRTLITVCAALLIGWAPFTFAGAGEDAALRAEEAALQAENAAQQARMESEYREAIAETEQSRKAGQVAVTRAQERQQRAAERALEASEESQRAQAARDAELAEMQEELNRARRELQETSREVARVSREVARARVHDRTGDHFVYRTTQKPVIGVILSNSSEVGIEVIGVSPDGPAERAGIEQGDILVAMAGHELGTGVDDEGDDRLKTALGELKAGDAVVVTYRRNGKLVDVEVVPEVREPISWHTVTRFPSVASPEEVISIESIVLPEIDTAELAERIERIKVEVATSAMLTAPPRPDSPREAYQLELHELSDLGNTALYEANVWFGLPITKGLKLAEIEAGLGEYFKTDRGVLVLKARKDNELQLESGDIILDVGETEVNSPAEFMRALREVEPGEEVALEIKRNRKNKTLKTTMPEQKLGHFFPGHDTSHTITYSYSTD